MRRWDRALLIIAHRGASAVAPESTAAAIREAARAGANMVELDVQMTQDRRLVIFHDDRLERTTTGTGALTRARYRQLAGVDAGAWFHPRYAGERVLLLSRALRLVPRRMAINLELKRTERRRAVLERVVRAINAAHVRRRMLVSSFDERLLRPLAASGLPLALICRHRPDASLARAIRLRCAAWHPFHAQATSARIARAHAHGLRVHVWTLDHPAQARRMIRRGVDGIVTNDPGRVLKGLQHGGV